MLQETLEGFSPARTVEWIGRPLSTLRMLSIDSWDANLAFNLRKLTGRFLTQPVVTHVNIVSTIACAGSVTSGVISMNGSMPELSEQTIEPSSFVAFPAGLVHSTTNENCEPATVLQFFPTGAPATAFFPASVSALPSNVLEASLPGLGDGDAIREVFAQQTGPFASLGEECMMRCGMQASNDAGRWYNADQVLVDVLTRVTTVKQWLLRVAACYLLFEPK
jgi:hypothetical protein